MTCRKMVEGKGAGVAYPCDLGLPEGHDGPCAAKEKPSSVATRRTWEAERAVEDGAMSIEGFQHETRTTDYVTNPAPYPGERGFPQMPTEWQVHTAPDGKRYAFVPVMRRWLPVHHEPTNEAGPRTVTVQLPDGNREQRVALPRPSMEMPLLTSETVLAEPEDYAEAIRAERAAHPMQILRVQDQPPPEESEGDVWAEIIEDMTERRQVGIDRYGTPLQRFNGRDAMTDAYQEALDLLVYLRQHIGEREILKALYARVYAALDQATFRDPEVNEAVETLAQILGVVPTTVAPEEGSTDARG